MKFTFTDKKVTLPKSVHAYAEKKVGKLERYFPTEPEASVVFGVEKGRNQVEVTVRAGGTILRASESTADMLASIDAAVADMERQLNLFANQRLVLHLRRQREELERYRVCEQKSKALVAQMGVLCRMGRPGRLNEENRRRLGRVYGVLGVTAGLFLAIVLI